MKIEKKLWITLFVFGLFAIGFSGWIFSQSTAREKLLWDNTIRFETKKLTDGEIKSENIALPKDFDIPRSILFKTTHTIAEVWLDGEKIYESDISKAFDDVKRVVVNNNKEINIATTSCKIVNWKTFDHELLVNNFDIKKKWISHNIPEFNPAMCVIVCRKGR